MLDPRLGYALWALRLAVGVDSIVLGLQRFASEGPLTRWAGVLELVAGVLIFTPLTERAAYFLTGWLLLLLALRVATPAGQSDLVFCDVLLATGAFALARLTRVNETAETKGEFHRSGSDTGPQGTRV